MITTLAIPGASRNPSQARAGNRGRLAGGVYPWLPLAGSLLLILRITVFARQREDFAAVDIYALAEIFICLFCFLLICWRPEVLRELWRRLRGTSGRVFTAFWALSLLSATWSTMVPYSAFRAFESVSQSAAILVTVFLLAGFERREKVVLVTCLGVLLIEAGAGAWWTSSLRDNSSSASAAMIFCYGFGQWPYVRGKRRWLLLITCGFGLLFVILGQSLASLWSLLFGCAVTLAVSRPHRILFLVVAPCVLGLLLCLPEVRHELLYRGKSESDVVTLTGRTFLWESYWDAFMRRPTFGYGYAIAARTQGVVYQTNTHNSFFAVITSTGLAGLVLCGWALIRWAKEGLTSAHRRASGAIGCLSALSAGLLNSMSLSLLAESWCSPTFVFTAFYALHVFELSSSWRGRPGMPATPRALNQWNLLLGHRKPRWPRSGRPKSLTKRCVP